MLEVVLLGMYLYDSKLLKICQHLFWLIQRQKFIIFYHFVYKSLTFSTFFDKLPRHAGNGFQLA